MRRTLTALTLAAATVAAVPAHAEASDSQRVQVLAMMSDDGFQQAQALTIALKRAVTRAEGWSLGKGDFSLEVMVAALNCPSPPDSSCQQKIGKKVGTNRYVWGTLKLEGKEAVAVLHLWENGAEKQQTTLRYSANLTDASDDTLLKIAEDGFSKLVGAAEGKLGLTAGNVSGDVLVDGQPAGSIKNGHSQLSLPAGEHEVRVRAAGYHEAIGTVTIKPGESTDLTLSPSPVAGATGPGDQGGGNTPTDYRKIAGWATVGVGGAVALTGGAFWLKSFLQTQNPPDGFQAYAKDFKSGDVCQHAQDNSAAFYPDANLAEHRAAALDYCDSNSQTKTIAFILLPVGAVIAGVGTYLLVTDKPQHEKVEGKRIQPFLELGPRGGRLDVRMTF